ncbi:hypothetical protein YC2023_078203 [Brassica napus]
MLPENETWFIGLIGLRERERDGERNKKSNIVTALQEWSATDSSSHEDDKVRLVKSNPPPPRSRRGKLDARRRKARKYRGVRQRRWGARASSVLRFNVEELETEPTDLAAEVKPNVAESLFPDPYSLPELSLAGEYFWGSPEPLFMDFSFHLNRS